MGLEKGPAGKLLRDGVMAGIGVACELLTPFQYAVDGWQLCLLTRRPRSEYDAASWRPEPPSEGQWTAVHCSSRPL